MWGHLNSAGIACKIYFLMPSNFDEKMPLCYEGNTLGILRRSFFPQDLRAFYTTVYVIYRCSLSCYWSCVPKILTLALLQFPLIIIRPLFTASVAVDMIDGEHVRYTVIKDQYVRKLIIIFWSKKRNRKDSEKSLTLCTIRVYRYNIFPYSIITNKNILWEYLSETIFLNLSGFLVHCVRCCKIIHYCPVQTIALCIHLLFKGCARATK